MDKKQIKRMCELALLATMIVVLQLLSAILSKFAILPVSLTLTLLPVVLGGYFYGVRGGAFLGGVFGVIVLVLSATGMDAGGLVLWTANPIITAILCVVKGAAAGAASGLISSLLKKKNKYVASITAAIVAPVVNTGLFVLGMFVFFKDILTQWAGDTEIMYYVIFVLAGINFVVEFAVNVIFAPFIPRISKALARD